MNKERESARTGEHKNLSIVPASSTPVDEDGHTPATAASGSDEDDQHNKQRSTSVLIKNYLNTQDIEANTAIIGDASPTHSRDTDLETSVNNFAAAVERQNTYSMSTNITHQRLGQSYKKGMSIYYC